MNDFSDAAISRALGSRADKAPTHQPDFGDVLAVRAQQLRRRSAVGATAVVVVGITGLAALAGNGGEAPSSADGPVPSDDASGDVSTTTWVEDLDALWYCEGAVDLRTNFPATTTTVPVTTIGPTGVDIAPPAFDPPTADSGFFRHCELVQPDFPPVTAQLDSRTPTTTTFAEQVPPSTVILGEPDVPTTTNASGGVIEPNSGSYVVQAGDYAILIADKFGVSLDDLMAFNGWDSGAEFPFPGETVLIPPPMIIGVDTTTTSLLASITTDP